MIKVIFFRVRMKTFDYFFRNGNSEWGVKKKREFLHSLLKISLKQFIQLLYMQFHCAVKGQDQLILPRQQRGYLLFYLPS